MTPDASAAERLLPCPFCGLPGNIFEAKCEECGVCGSKHIEHYLQCPRCGAHGPSTPKADRVAAMWNGRVESPELSALRARETGEWTSEPPTELGWYWMRERLDGTDSYYTEPGCALLAFEGGSGREGWRIRWNHCEFAWQFRGDTERWSVPIAAPAPAPAPSAEKKHG